MKGGREGEEEKVRSPFFSFLDVEPGARSRKRCMALPYGSTHEREEGKLKLPITSHLLLAWLVCDVEYFHPTPFAVKSDLKMMSRGEKPLSVKPFGKFIIINWKDD
jgi:hypothetical protein